MKRHFIFQLALWLLFWSAFHVPPLPAQSRSATPPLVTASGTRLFSPDGSELRLRGISLGNWLLPEGYMFNFEKAVSPRQIREVTSELLGPDASRSFWQEFQEKYVTSEDIRLIAGCGFDSIRVPFDYRLFMPEDHPEIKIERGFELLDRVISWARREKLWVILDLHGAPGGQTGENIDNGWGYPWLFESPKAQQLTIDLWRSIAARYRHEPVVLGYELLNEPIPHFPEYAGLLSLLEPFYKRLVAAIREVDPDHLIILGGAKWNSDFSVFHAPFAPGLIYSFHKYWTAPDISVISDYLAFRDRYQVPIWCGESGENTLEWIAAFRRTLEEQRVPWCFWPYKKLSQAGLNKDSPKPGEEACVGSIRRPGSWEAIVRYADRLRGGTYEEKRQKRPAREAAQAVFEEFLLNLQPSRLSINQAFLRALGLHRSSAASFSPRR